MKRLSAFVVLTLAVLVSSCTTSTARSLAATLRRPTHHPTSAPLAATSHAPSHDAPWVMQRPDVYIYTRMVIPHNSVSGEAIAQFGLRYVGFPYTLTGNSPSLGFSCIGFVSYVYGSFGIPLPDDLWNARAYAPAVPFGDLRPGDILWFGNTVWPGLSHTAIYIGGGRFVHSAWFGIGVIVSSFSNDPRYGNYWTTHYMGASRPWGGAGSGTPSFSSFRARHLYPNNLQVVPGAPVVLVTAAFQRLRRWWALSAPVIDRAPQGTPLFPLQRKGYWYEVSTPIGITGWIPTAESVPVLGTTSGAINARASAIGNEIRPVRARSRRAFHTRRTSRQRRHVHRGSRSTGNRLTRHRLHHRKAPAGVIDVPDLIANAPVVSSGQTPPVPTTTATSARATSGSDATVGADDTGNGCSDCSGKAATPAPTPTVTPQPEGTSATAVWKVATQVTHVMTDTSAGASVETTLQLGDAYQVLLVSKSGQYVALLDGQRGWIDVHPRQKATVRSSSHGRARKDRRAGVRLPAPTATCRRAQRSQRTGVSQPASTATSRSRHRCSPRQNRGSAARAKATARTRVTVRLHVRAGIRARVLTLVPGNTPVRELGRSGNWVHVQLRNGRQGYVYGMYLTGR